ncbi:MAG: YerC/YecD family TrpR-related protein [Ruminococcus sp.]|nr:YerC/YecD family TrpR-related protein [Ruminococcus sp.]
MDSEKTEEKTLDFLYEAILTLKTKEECAAFLDDLCTPFELNAISQRLLVAKMLSEKKIYNNIVAATGASTATISRVNRTLNNRYTGGGYRIVFERLENFSSGDFLSGNKGGEE